MSQVQSVTFDVALFSYIDRPIFDVFANGRWVGDAVAYGGGQGLITGVSFPRGRQVVTWLLGGPEGMPRNVETVTAKSQPVLTEQQAQWRYLGIHGYPDETVAFLPIVDWPHRTERGEAISRAAGLRYGRGSMFDTDLSTTVA
ncbi:MAG: hypothetical protein U5L74_15265 [Ideonella sp.]|nr:hypothetical protein [Ideonella sp.]